MCAVSLLCLSCTLEEPELADISQTVSTSLWLQLRQRERFKISKKGLKPKHPLAGGDIIVDASAVPVQAAWQELGCTKTSQCLEKAGVWPCFACAQTSQHF